MAPRARRADRNEVRAALGTSVKSGLLRSYYATPECFVIKLYKEPIAIFGVTPYELPDLDYKGGYIWLIGTDDIESVPITFLRLSKEWVRYLESQFDYLTNYIDARNELHIKWLSWLGYKIVEPLHEFGHEQRLFFRFHKICALPY